MGVPESPSSRIPKGPSSGKSSIPIPIGVKSRENTRVASRSVTPTGIPKFPVAKETSSKPAANKSKSTTITIAQGRSITKPVTRTRSKTPKRSVQEDPVKRDTAIQVLQSVRNLTLSKTKNSYQPGESLHDMSHRPSLHNPTYEQQQHSASHHTQHRPSIHTDDRDALYARIHDPVNSSGYKKTGDYVGVDRGYKQMGSGGRNYSHEEGPTEDISNLFPRPNTAPLKPQSYLDYKGHIPFSSDEQRRNSQSAPYRANNPYQNIPNQRIPERSTFHTPPIAGLKYSRDDDLDQLLSKYKSKPQAHSGHEYTVYSATVTLDAEKDPDFSRTPFATKHGNNGNDCLGGTMEKGHANNSPGDGGANHPVDVDHLIHQAVIRNKVTHEKPTHEFPFRETAFGDLIVQPEQIAFECKTMSVLVADPTKIHIMRKEKMPSVYDQEILAAQIEEVMHKSLNQLANGHSDRKPGGGNPPPLRTAGVADGPTDWTSLEDDLEGKEVVHIRYSSNTAMGTEKLMSEMHQRIKLGRNADTHVVIGNKVFPCHSLVLEVYSTYFDNLISNRARHSVRRVNLPEAEVSDEIFPVVMDWIMQNEGGRGSVINKTNVVSVFSAAKYLDIAELKLQCVKFLKEKVETNDRYLMNLWEDVKRRPHCQELMSVISAKAAASFQHIYQERQFHKLDVDELVMLLSSDDIVIDSELEVYDTAVRWLLRDWDTRKICTNQVMSSVRFGLLSPLELTQIAHSPEMSKNEELRDYGEVLSYGNVKSLIDDGLAFSIINLSYANQPEKLQSWIESTGIKQPRPRTHLIHHHHKSNPDSSQGHVADQLPRIRNSRSYTIVKDPVEPHIPHGLHLNAGRANEQDDHEDKGSFGNDSGQINDRRNVAGLPGLHSSPSSSQESNPARIKPSHSPLQQALDKAGQPFKQEDIQSLGERRSRNNSQRSKSSGRYHYQHNNEDNR